mmetsp:Transcript_13199/g.13253  ORF Transcript_13199/g.13253 Transcript_13199/m.13253 type:complete len:183 (-) Transcript_13199:203-751(-)
MNLLNYGNDEDDSDSDDSSVDQKLEKPLWQKDDSDSDDAEKTLEKRDNEIRINVESGTKLMSANELFSSVSSEPDFLKTSVISTQLETSLKATTSLTPPLPSISSHCLPAISSSSNIVHSAAPNAVRVEDRRRQREREIQGAEGSLPHKRAAEREREVEKEKEKEVKEVEEDGVDEEKKIEE